MTILYSEEKNIPLGHLLALYGEMKWTEYEKQPERLEKAFQKSLYVLSAWDNEKLVGLVRVIGDDATIIYIQDLLVHTGYQRKKIGTTLVKTVFKKYSDIRQIVLLADENNEARRFYESAGFVSSDDYHMTAFVKVK